MLDCHIKNAWAKKYILIHLVGRWQNQVHVTAQKSKWCKSSLNWMKLCTMMMWEIFILESYSMSSISYFTFKRIFSTKIQIVISKRVQRLHFWKCFSWKERAGPKVNKSYYIMITIMRFGAAFFTSYLSSLWNVLMFISVASDNIFSFSLSSLPLSSERFMWNNLNWVGLTTHHDLICKAGSILPL